MNTIIAAMIIVFLAGIIMSCICYKMAGTFSDTVCKIALAAIFAEAMIVTLEVISRWFILPHYIQQTVLPLILGAGAIIPALIVMLKK